MVPNEVVEKLLEDLETHLKELETRTQDESLNAVESV
jgi:hypothetical protein